MLWGAVTGETYGRATVLNTDSNEFEVPKTTGETSQRDRQLSLLEMFVFMTCSALSIWMYNNLHPFFALAIGAAIVFVLIMRMLGKRSVVVGGMCGFVVAMVMSAALCLTGFLDTAFAATLMLMGPCMGYVVGGLITEFRDEGF